MPCTTSFSWAHSQARRCSGSSVSRRPHHLFQPVLCVVQGIVHSQQRTTTCLFRSLRGKTEAGKSFEILLEQIRGVHGKGSSTG